jgi:hypothetical protein
VLAVHCRHLGQVVEHGGHAPVGPPGVVVVPEVLPLAVPQHRQVSPAALPHGLAGHQPRALQGTGGCCEKVRQMVMEGLYSGTKPKGPGGLLSAPFGLEPECKSNLKKLLFTKS